MPKSRVLIVVLTALLMAGMGAALVQGQDAGGAPPAGGNGGNGGNGGQTQPQDRRAQFRQMMNDRIKTLLAASDDDMKVIGPRVEKVMRLRFDSFTMMGSLFSHHHNGGEGDRGDRGGREDRGDRGDRGDRPQSAVSKAATDLQTTLEDGNAGTDVIKAKLDALHAARAQAKKDMDAAQKDLRDVLTLHQEAELTAYGILD